MGHLIYCHPHLLALSRDQRVCAPTGRLYPTQGIVRRVGFVQAVPVLPAAMRTARHGPGARTWVIGCSNDQGVTQRHGAHADVLSRSAR